MLGDLGSVSVFFFDEGMPRGPSANSRRLNGVALNEGVGSALLPAASEVRGVRSARESVANVNSCTSHRKL